MPPQALPVWQQSTPCLTTASYLRSGIYAAHPPPAPGPPPAAPLRAVFQLDSRLFDSQGSVPASAHQDLPNSLRSASPSALGFINNEGLTDAFRRVRPSTAAAASLMNCLHC